MYHANGLHKEALNSYTIIVKNKQYPQASRLRVNMGNIYFEQKKYPLAIKMYNMGEPGEDPIQREKELNEMARDNPFPMKNIRYNEKDQSVTFEVDHFTKYGFQPRKRVKRDEPEKAQDQV